jgi:hypothetical protein
MQEEIFWSEVPPTKKKTIFHRNSLLNSSIWMPHMFKTILDTIGQAINCAVIFHVMPLAAEMRS